LVVWGLSTVTNRMSCKGHSKKKQVRPLLSLHLIVLWLGCIAITTCQTVISQQVVASPS
jgi:hypothetical protein